MRLAPNTRNTNGKKASSPVFHHSTFRNRFEASVFSPTTLMA